MGAAAQGLVISLGLPGRVSGTEIECPLQVPVPFQSYIVQSGPSASLSPKLEAISHQGERRRVQFPLLICQSNLPSTSILIFSSFVA